MCGVRQRARGNTHDARQTLIAAAAISIAAAASVTTAAAASVTAAASVSTAAAAVSTAAAAEFGKTRKWRSGYFQNG